MKTDATNTSNSLRLQQLLDGQVAMGILRDHVFSSWKTLGQPSDLRVERYWPGRDETFSIEWSFCLDQGQRFSLYGHALPEGVSPQFCKPANDKPTINGQVLWGVSVYVSDWHLTVHSPDCDAVLDQLDVCLNDAPLLARNIHAANNTNGNEQFSPQATCQLMGYRAGRRAALHCSLVQKDGETENLFCKMYRDDRGYKLIRRHGKISDQLHMMTHGLVRVPDPIRYDAQLRMAQFGWTSGQKISLDNPNFAAQLELVAKALATFHNIELDDLKTFTHENEWHVVKRWTTLMNTIAPQHHSLLDSLSTMLHEASTHIDDDALATLHRDYYPAQLLMDGERITILDLDTVARGHRCVDIGNFLAHLLLEIIANKSSAADTWPTHCQSFIRAYMDQGGTCRQHALTYYLGSSLIRIGMVHSLRHNGGRIAAQLWDTAKHLLSDPHSMLTINDNDLDSRHGKTAKYTREMK